MYRKTDELSVAKEILKTKITKVIWPLEDIYLHQRNQVRGKHVVLVLKKKKNVIV